MQSFSLQVEVDDDDEVMPDDGRLDGADVVVGGFNAEQIQLQGYCAQTEAAAAVLGWGSFAALTCSDAQFVE